MQIRIYYEDTDAGGIVYHTNYIKYCERARSDIFFKKDMMPGAGSDFGFVVRDLKAKFLASAKLGDLLDIKTVMLEHRRSTIRLLQEIYLDDKKLFSMEVLLVYIEEGKPRRIPDDIAAVFGEYKYK